MPRLTRQSRLLSSRSRGTGLRRRNLFRPLLEQLESRRLLAAVNWISDSDGFWDEPGNWLDDQGANRVPAFGDDVTIDRAGADVTVTIRDVERANTVTSTESLAIEGRIRIDNEATIDGNLVVTGEFFAGAGTLNGNTQWLGGKINGTITNVGTLTLAGPNDKDLNESGVLNNEGLIVHSGDGNLIHTGRPSAINNLAGAVWDLQSDADLGGVTFNNFGTLRKSAGDGESLVTVSFHNTGGTIDVQTGAVTMTGGGNYDGGTFDVATGAKLELDRSGGSTLSYQGVFTGSGGGRVELAEGDLNVNGATFNFPAGLFHWSGGRIASGQLVNQGVIELSGANDKNLSESSVLDNEGLVVHSGEGNLIHTGRPSAINNLAGGVWDLQSDADLGGVTFNNSGTLLKSAGNGESVISVTFHNTGGTIDVQTGAVTMTGGGNYDGGTFDVAAGAKLELDRSGGSAPSYQGVFTGSGGGRVELAEGDLNVVGATFNFPAGLFHWTGGRIASGQLVNQGVIELSGANDKNLSESSVLDNEGLVVHSGEGNLIHTGRPSAINNLADGVWDLQSDADLGGVTFNNTGTLLKSAGIGESMISVTFHNTGGTIDVQTGTAVMTGGGNYDGGTFDVAAGAKLELDRDGGSTPFYQGDFTGSGGGRVELAEGDLNVGGANFDFPAGLFHWSGGRIFGGQLVNQGVIELSGPNDKNLSASSVLVNESLIVQTGIGNLIRTGGISGINNLAGGIWDLQSDADLAGVIFNNTGTFRKSAGNDVSDVSLTFNNNGGTIDAQSGRVQFSGNGLQENSHFQVQAGAVVELSRNGLDAAGRLTGSGFGEVRLTGSITGQPVHLDFPEGFFHWVGNDSVSNSSGEIINDGFITLEGPEEVRARAYVVNNGTVIHPDDVTFRLQQTSEIINRGLWDFRGDGDIFISDFTNIGSVLHNLGEIRKSAGLGISAISSNLSATSFLNNTGTIDVRSGTMELLTRILQLEPDTRGDTLHGGTWKVGPFSTLAIVPDTEILTNHANVILEGEASTFTAIDSLQVNTGLFQLGGGRDVTTNGDWINGGERLDTRMTQVFSNRQGRQAGLAIDPVTSNIFVHPRNSDFVFERTADGTLVNSFAEPTNVGNLMDMDFTSAPLNLGGVNLPAGTLLWSDGDDDPGEVFAVDKSDGSILAQVRLTSLQTELPGVAHHGSRGTLFVLGSDRMIYEINASNGSTINQFPINPTGAPGFSLGVTGFGDVEVNETTGNLYVVGSGQVVVRELTPTGEFVQDFDLSDLGPANNGSEALLTGLAVDNATGEIWLLDELELIYQFSPPVIGTFGRTVLGPGSMLTVSGDFTDVSSSTVDFQIGGRPDSGLFGRLEVAQTADFTGGHVDVQLVDGFGQTDGDVYEIVTYANRSGELPSFTGVEPFFTAAVGDTNIVLNGQDTGTTVDLAVDPSGFITPDRATVGDAITVTYRVVNNTDEDVSKDWLDAIYLIPSASASPQRTGRDQRLPIDSINGAVLLGRAEHSGGVGALSTYENSFTGIVPPAISGPYRIAVVADSNLRNLDPDRSNNLAAATSITIVSVRNLPLDATPVMDAFGTADDMRLFQFETTEPGQVDVRLDSIANEGTAEIFVAKERVPALRDFDFVSSQISTPDPTVSVVIDGPGVWYVLASARSLSGLPAEFEISASIPDLSVTRVTPGVVGNLGDVTLEVEGTLFQSGSVFELVGQNNVTRTATAVTLEDATLAYVTFNTTGLAPGSYQLRAVAPDGALSTTTALVQVEQAVTARIDARVIAPAAVRFNRPFKVFLEYTNDGNVDVHAPLLQLIGPIGMGFGLERGKVDSRTSLGILGVSSRGPADVLRPGQTERITIHGDFLPEGRNQFGVDVRVMDPGAPDLTLVNWSLLEPRYRPKNIPEATWTPIWNDFTSRMGATWDEVQLTLAGQHQQTSLVLIQDLMQQALSDVIRQRTTGAPIVVSHSGGGFQPNAADRVFVEFSKPIDASTFTPDDIEATDPAGQPFSALTVSAVNDRTFVVTFPPQTVVGLYHVLVGPDITDTDGRPMDQDRDGTAGEPDDDRYDAAFAILPQRPAPDPPPPLLVTLQLPTGEIDARVGVDTVLVSFSRPVFAATFGTNDVELVGPSGAINVTGISRLDSTLYAIDFAHQDELGTYTISIGPEITDHDSQQMDQNVNGIDGERPEDIYIGSFEIVDLEGPRIIDQTPQETVEGPVSFVDVTFNEDVDETTFTSEDVTIAGPNGNVVVTSVLATSPNTFRIGFDDQNFPGPYVVSVGPAVADLHGNLMDQDQDEVNGTVDDVFVGEFEILPSTLVVSGRVMYEGDLGELFPQGARVAVELWEQEGDRDNQPGQEEGGDTADQKIAGTMFTNDRGEFVFDQDMDGNALENIDPDDGGLRQFYILVMAWNEHAFVVGGDTIENVDRSGEATWINMHLGQPPADATPAWGQLYHDQTGLIEPAVDESRIDLTIPIPDAAADPYWHSEWIAFAAETMLQRVGELPRRTVGVAFPDNNPVYANNGRFVDHQGSDVLTHDYIAISQELARVPTTVLHEYGHAIQFAQNAYSRTPYRDAPYGIIDESVDATGAPAPETAFAEAWASFFAVFIEDQFEEIPRDFKDDVAINRSADLEANDYWMGQDGHNFAPNGLFQDDQRGLAATLPSRFSADDGVNDNANTGEIVLGAIMSIFHDLADRANDDGVDQDIAGLWQAFTSVAGTGTIEAFYDAYPNSIAADHIFIDHGIPVADDQFPDNDDIQQAENLGTIDSSLLIEDLIIAEEDPGRGDWFSFRTGTVELPDEPDPDEHRDCDDPPPPGPNDPDPPLFTLLVSITFDDTYGDLDLSVSVDGQLPEVEIGRLGGYASIAIPGLDATEAHSVRVFVAGHGAMDELGFASPFGGDYHPEYDLFISAKLPEPAEPGDEDRDEDGDNDNDGKDDCDPPPPRTGINFIRSFDPNEKVGPAGFGDAGYIAPQTLFYTNFFENDPVLATAAAQVVRLLDQLEPDLDWTTFELGSISFGDVIVDIPPGRSSWQEIIDVSDTLGVVVEIDAGIDFQTGLVTWEFTSLDPLTGELTEDPFAGFLPPNDQTGRGEGSVEFFIEPLAGLPTGTEIRNQTRIFFDENEPIDTNETLNTIDDDPPSSSVDPLPTETMSETFSVSWTGTDQLSGSGIASFDIFVSTDNGPFELWLDDTAETSGMFSGEFDRTYAFYSVATDNVGHQELPPAVGDTTTTLVQFPDDDGDGASNELEDQGPNNGDANDDGTLDRDQAEVVSLVALTSRQERTIITNPDGRAFAGATAVQNPSQHDSPPETTFPIGFFQFELDDVDPGSAATVSISLPEDYTVDTYWRFGPTPDDPSDHWYEFEFDGTVGAEILEDEIVLHFVDGQLGDDDLTANGTIVDAGGPANSFVWQNDFNRFDVNDRDGVTTLDALVIINYLADNSGSSALPAPPASPPFYYDVNGSNTATTLDALQVINRIARTMVAEPEEIVLPGPLASALMIDRSQQTELDDRDSSDQEVIGPPSQPIKISSHDHSAERPLPSLPVDPRLRDVDSQIDSALDAEAVDQTIRLLMSDD